MGHHLHEKNLSDFKNWNETKEKVIYTHYDPIRGQCVTIDISPIHGLIQQRIVGQSTSLRINTKQLSNLKGYYVYFHNGTDIYGLHSNLPMVRNGGKHYGRHAIQIDKVLIDSLPTAFYHCGKNHFDTCFRNTLGRKLKQEHQTLASSFEDWRKICRM